MREYRHGPRRANGIRHDGARTRAVPLRDPDVVDTDTFEPLDLVAVQSDDELINALSGGYRVSGPDYGGYPADDRIATILAAWKAEVDAEPVPELLDLDTAVATVRAARPRSARIRHLAPLAAAAAFIVLAAGGVSVGSYSAQPDDTLWPVTQVVFPYKAASVQAASSAQEHIEKAKQALVAGRPDDAAHELAQARADIGAVRPEEGRVQLADVQDFLLVKAQETPPGIPADLAAPLATQPTRPVPPGVTVAVPDATSPLTSPLGPPPVRSENQKPTVPSNPAVVVPPVDQSADPGDHDPRDKGTKPTTEVQVPPPLPEVPAPAPDTGPVVTPGTPETVPETSAPEPGRTEGQAPVPSTGEVTGSVTPPTS
jgi:hypothetical protein